MSQRREDLNFQEGEHVELRDQEMTTRTTTKNEHGTHNVREQEGQGVSTVPNVGGSKTGEISELATIKCHRKLATMTDDPEVSTMKGDRELSTMKGGREGSTFKVGVSSMKGHGEGHNDQDLLLDNDDSDPPVENYSDYLEEEYEEEEEELETQDSNNNTSPGHDWLSAQEARRLIIQRRRAGGHFQRKRKRSNTNVDSNYIPPYKKRSRRYALPSKFLLGGNIRDPLNLASLADAKVNAALNAETPKSSPVPIPMYRHGEVPVFIPKNPDDPLGLTTEAENPYDFIAGIRKNNSKIRKHRHRKKAAGRKRTDSECSVDRSEDSDAGGTTTTGAKIGTVSGTKIGPQGSTTGAKVGATTVPKVGATTAAKSGVTAGLPGPKDTSMSSEEDSKNVTNVAVISEAPKPAEIQAKSAGENDQEQEAKMQPLLPPPKKKHRTRKRTKKTTNNSDLLFGKCSDYIPLGTPSVHEPTQYYEEFTADERAGTYREPFESPLINYCTSVVAAEHNMEPFSPPAPKPEAKRRRVEVEEIQQPAAPPPPPPLPAPPKEFKLPPPPKIIVSNNNNTSNNNNNRKRFRHKTDPIVSPVIPQPGSRRFPHHHYHHHHHHHYNHRSKKSEDKLEGSDQSLTSEGGRKFRKKDEVFQYGNYNRYYGYRTTDGDDLRLRAFPRDFFQGKDVLDVGCNIGHVTLLIARDYGANFVKGIDIDGTLIEVAKKNVKHYVDRDPTDETVRFPQSCSLMYGVLQPPPGTVGDTRRIPFPYNVAFKRENYVLENDEKLGGVKPEYDVILCLSISKWIHLNYGDDGLKRFLKRTFLHLRPGGKLVLEPQPWASYGKKKRLTERIFDNFKKIRFYPDKFPDYLLNQVGYKSVEKLATPAHHSKGFQRPLMVFTKEIEQEAKESQVGVQEGEAVPGPSSSNNVAPTTTMGS